MPTYITTKELSKRIKYHPRYIRTDLVDTVFIEGIHYIRPFGRRKILFIWEAIEEDMRRASDEQAPVIPLSAGGVIHG